MMMKKLYLFLVLNCLLSVVAFSKDIIQFSGFVRDAESNAVIPFCAVYIQNENRGTITGYDGFFTFAAGKGDTILVKSLGYKSFKIAIPKDLELTSFVKDVSLERETYELKGVTVRPLPTPEKLRYAVLNLDIPDNLRDLAQQTIENSILNDEISSKTNFDGKENFNQYVQSQAGYYYNRYGNQRPGISLTDPFAWARFIKDIKNKKKKK
ncbi:MAG: carboxypeptidase-like regulatory domain-containing protein [Bacteroidia bacterium]|nr:MAG: carboxypeptidase-like regulatory domain-containing protein [Bacteroidia bacterium]